MYGQRDDFFPERLYNYFCRLVDKYGNCIMVLAIYTDGTKSYYPSTYQYSLSKTRSTFNFNIYKVSHQKENDLIADNNTFALVVLTVLTAIKNERKKDDQELLRAKIKLLKNLQKRKLPEDKRAKLLTFIKLYADFEDQKIHLKFEEAIDKIIKKTKVMGIIEYAIQEAADRAAEVATRTTTEKIEQEKNVSFVSNLLQQTNFSMAKIASLAGVSLSFVRRVKASL